MSSRDKLFAQHRVHEAVEAARHLVRHVRDEVVEQHVPQLLGEVPRVGLRRGAARRGTMPGQ